MPGHLPRVDAAPPDVELVLTHLTLLSVGSRNVVLEPGLGVGLVGAELPGAGVANVVPDCGEFIQDDSFQGLLLAPSLAGIHMRLTGPLMTHWTSVS